MNITQPTAARPAPDLDDAALKFAQAHHQWQRLSAEPRSWTEPTRQRALADAFLRYHAAKLSLTEAAAPARTW